MPRIIRVDRQQLRDAREQILDGREIVRPVWADVDRPITSGWEVPSRALADRLERAILAGAVHADAKVATDINGQTYVAANSSRVLGRRMNADLKRLGF